MTIDPGPKWLAVSELTQMIKRDLESAFPSVSVCGEVSNLTVPRSGHLYFVLKDAEAQVRAVMFRGAAQTLSFQLDNGNQVIAHGGISVYAPRGDYQLLVRNLAPYGEGALRAAFERLKSRLAQEGLFDLERKRPLPSYPRVVGVVTSDTGAAIRDILNVLERRHAGISVLLFPVRVQGQGAALEIARAIREMNRLSEADVLIVGRGGGSLEDLWAFNEEPVARAIAASRIPVVSAVGHERDFTIADYVADLRAPTPSAAAELVSESRADLLATIARLEQSIGREIRGRLGEAERRLDALEHRLAREMQNRESGETTRLLAAGQRLIREARSRLALQNQRADELERRLESMNPKRRVQEAARTHRAMLRRLELARSAFSLRSRHRLAGAETRLHAVAPGPRMQQERLRLQTAGRRLVAAMRTVVRNSNGRTINVAQSLDLLSPLAVLSRGYAVARKREDGTIVHSVSIVSVGDALDVMIADGRVEATVTRKEMTTDAGI
ncbi:MAG: exodeoxyribonuclease VII large subunit [Candidatus Schekmanbacteria bacterium]|nr:exodeoxyribonuclease VII large subunit [Candidatus Schekmanbacteria bacterium]